MDIREMLNDYETFYLYIERYVNDGSPSKIDNTTSERTKPRSKYKYLTLRQYEFGDDAIIEEYGDVSFDEVESNTMIFHPDMIRDPYIKEKLKDAKELQGIKVSPTASGRTTKVLSSPYFIKLSYSKLLGRIKRIITKPILLASCETTKMLMRIIDEKRVGDQFAILREDAGRVITFKNQEECVEWGVLFREFKPYPYIAEKEYLLPFFSLFGKDSFNEEDLPIVIQLFKMQNLSIEEFLLKKILIPLYRTYFEALIYGGIELEAHAQNMMISLDKNFNIIRIVCRDLESAGRDMPLLEKNNFDTNLASNPYKCNYETGQAYSNGYSKYTISHSFMFDFKLGEYITTPLLNCVERHMSFDRQYIVDNLRQHNQEYIKKLPEGFFPKEWCYYDSIVWGDKKREYIWEYPPHYR